VEDPPPASPPCGVAPVPWAVDRLAAAFSDSHLPSSNRGPFRASEGEARHLDLVSAAPLRNGTVALRYRRSRGG